MPAPFLPTILILVVFVHAPGWGQSSAVVLFGELKVNEPETRQKLPQTFQIVLRNLGDVILGRETTTANGQYRFNGVTTGEYSLAVEVNGVEVARVRFYLSALAGTSFQKDLELQWRVLRPKPETPESADLVTYARSASQQTLFENAQRETQSGNLRQALAFLEMLLEQDPNDHEAASDLGTLHYRLGQPNEAASSYRRAIESRPDYALAWFNLGKLQFEEQDYPASRTSMSRTIELGLVRAEAFYVLGEVCLQLKQGSKAVEHFKRALEMDPDEMAEAHLRLAALYDAAGQRDLAAAECRKFLERRPDSPRREEIEAYLEQLDGTQEGGIPNPESGIRKVPGLGAATSGGAPGNRGARHHR